MPENNDKEKTREKRIELTKTILASIAVLGIVPFVAVVPGVIKIIEPFIGNKRRYRTPTYVVGVMGKLQKRGLIEVYYEGGVQSAKLTKKGEQILLKMNPGGDIGKKKWDGKWRVVVFDIRESKRERRDALRKHIARYGFLKLQNSVWVYPHSCEELVALLKAECHVGQELLYMTVDKIENDVWLKKKFHLE